MSHPFGDLLSQYRNRKHGLSQARLAELVGYDPSVIAKMAQGRKELTGPSGRERVVRLVGVLREEGVLTQLEEANALLKAAGMPSLYNGAPNEAALIHRLKPHVVHETPPLQDPSSFATRCTNLPGPLTRFIGRERQVAELVERVQACRLLTLTGAGGVGKTRLAVEVGATLIGAMHRLEVPVDQGAMGGASPLPFAHGVWLAELAPLGDPALVAPAVAQVFALTKVPGRSLLDILTAHLRDKRFLLVLDNCEHLIQVCAELAVALLRACPGVHILATSREPLRVPGEVTWRVPSLSTPDLAHSPDVDAVGEYEAVQLFVEHATAAQPGFALTAQNSPAVAQVCTRLDGIPLAIELSAARLRGLPVEEIASRLDNRFSLLTSGSRTALPRQQTLRATLDWSYALLSRSEQMLLARLAVFAGGWTTELAEYVCADTTPHGAFGPDDVLPLLLQLVEKSLVVADAEPRDGVMRYHMLETVRQYAAERLHELGESDCRYELLAEYVVSTLTPDTRQSRQLSNEQVVARMGSIEAELDNLRALVAWARTRTDGVVFIRLAAAFGDYWGVAMGHMAEVQAWLEDALVRGATVPPVVRAKALNGLLRTAYFRGYNLARWSAQAEETVALSAQGDDPYERCQSLCYACGVQFGLYMLRELWTQPAAWDARSHLSQMESLAAEGLALGQQLKFPLMIHTGLKFQGRVRLLQGDPVAARRYYEAGLQLALEADDTEVLWAIEMLDSIDPAGALAAWEQEGSRQRARGERESLAQALRELGELVAESGDLERARDLLRESLALRHKLDIPWNLADGIGILHCDLGQIALLQGHYPETLDHLQRALNINQKAGVALEIAHIHLYTGLAHLHLGNATRASGDLHQALNLYREMDDVQFIPSTLAALGMLAQVQRQFIRAGRLAGAASQWQGRAEKWQWFAQPSRRVPERLFESIGSLRDNSATAAAWIEGQQMSLEDAVEYALSTG